MTTVLIAEGSSRLGDLVGQLLDDDHRFEVVAVVSTRTEVLRLAALHEPDVVLVSQHLEGAAGATVCTALRAASPGSALLLWSSDLAGDDLRSPDVDAVLERGVTYEQLARAVRQARRSPQERPRLVNIAEEAGELRYRMARTD